MNKNVDSKNENVSPQNSQDTAALLKKILHKLDYIEKKIDSLSDQSKPRMFRDKDASGPYKKFDKPIRTKERKRDGKKEEVSSEGKFYHGRPFAKKKDSRKSNFRKKKRPLGRSSKEARGTSL